MPCLWHTPLTQAVGQTFMKITIDIQLALYEKMENALMSKTMRDALNDPLVMIGWHVVSARSAQQNVQRTCATCGDSGRGIPTLQEPDGAEEGCVECGARR